MTAGPDLALVAPDLYRLRVPDGPAHALNCYLWVGPDGVALFDTGWAHSASLVERALRELGRSTADVGHVVLSHFHEDHAGAAAEISGWPNAIVVASALEAPAVRGDVPGPLPVLTPAETAIHEQPTEPPRAAACRVDLEVADGDVLPIGGEARVLVVPGHTDGSLALHLPRLDAVLTGDTVAELDGTVILGGFDVDRELTRQSLLRIADTGAAVAGVGHGEALLADAHARIRDADDPFAR